MPRYGRKKITYAPAPKPRSTFRKKTTRLSKSLRSAIRKVVVKQEEKKMFVSTGSATLTYSSGTSTPVFPTLVPAISQGAGQGQRIGNQVKITSNLVNLQFTQAGTLNTDSPSLIRVMIISTKNAPTTTPTLTGLFQNGNTSVDPVAGISDYNDFIRKVNRDVYMVAYDKVIKVGSANSTVSYASNLNNDFHNYVRLNLNMTKKLGQVQKFNDATTNPISRYWYLVCFVQPADKSTYTSLANTHVNLTVYQAVNFVDA